MLTSPQCVYPRAVLRRPKLLQAVYLLLDRCVLALTPQSFDNSRASVCVLDVWFRLARDSRDELSLCTTKTLEEH